MLNTAPTVEQIRAAACTWRLAAFDADGKPLWSDDYASVQQVAKSLQSRERIFGGHPFYELLGLLPKAPGTSVESEAQGTRMVLSRLPN